MSTLQKYIDQNNTSRYQISKISGIAASTLQRAVDSPQGIDGISLRIIKAISITLNKTPGTVLDEIIEMEDK